MLMNLSHAVKTIRLKVDGTNWTGAAGTTDLTSESVDMQGFHGVRFIIGLGAIVSGAVTSVYVRQGTDTAMSDGTALLASAQTIADSNDNGIFVTEIFRPRERFLDVVTDRGTQNATVDFLLAELFSASQEPVTQHATVIGLEVHASPAEGAQ